MTPDMDSFQLYDRIALAITRATALLQYPDDLLGEPVASHRPLHQHFRIDPRSLTFPEMKARPGDVVIIREEVAVLLHHDLYPEAIQASYALAASDFTAVLRALLTRTEISGLAHPKGARRIVRRSSQSIEQEIVLLATYHVTLPEAAGPE